MTVAQDMTIHRPLSLVLVLSSPAPALPRPSSVEVARLINQLGSQTFSEREEASNRLESLTLRALPALQKAKNSEDAEVRRRANRLIGLVQEWELAPQVLCKLRVPGRLPMSGRR